MRHGSAYEFCRTFIKNVKHAYHPSEELKFANERNALSYDLFHSTWTFSLKSEVPMPAHLNFQTDTIELVLIPDVPTCLRSETLLASCNVPLRK